MSDEPSTNPALPPERVAALIEEGIQVIDVRRPLEYEGGHLAGAVNVEMNDLSARSGEIARDRPVLFYCRGGNRSAMAADAFREAGHDAYSLAGGLEAWVAAGHAIEPEDGTVITPPPPS